MDSVTGSEEALSRGVQIKPDPSQKKARKGGGEPQQSDWQRSIVSLNAMITERISVAARMAELDEDIKETAWKVSQMSPG